MKVAALLFLTLISSLWTQIASTVVKAAVGETVTVECPQAANQRNRVISWCKATSKQTCDIIVNTGRYVLKNDKRRASITNDNGLIAVTITQLQERDTGTYFCGTQNTKSLVISDVILLKVFTGSWTPNTSQVNGVMGNATTVQCLYTEQYKDYEKFFCKVTSVNKCTTIASSDRFVENLYNRTASIITNDYHNFTVTMSNVSKGDEGDYWCGAAKIVEIEITQVKFLMISEATRGPTVSVNIASNTAQQTWYIILPVVLGLLVLSLIVLFIWKKKWSKTARNEGNNENREPPITINKFDSEAEDMITYSTVTVRPPAQTEGSSATYANLKDLKEQNGGVKINSSEAVEYSTLSFKS